MNYAQKTGFGALNTKLPCTQSLPHLALLARDASTTVNLACKVEVTCQVLHCAHLQLLASGYPVTASQLRFHQESEGGLTDCCVRLRQEAKAIEDGLGSQVTLKIRG